ncbi:ABC transporter permease [Marispirochaeta sp.]|jgi:rhamnose transport system permease protein|uniref:ABC transporter permease n=1 Tax=Marispirochaeta sp. TaxID=2038653 RepID=UPI0029C61338|nr:ABC transporter permease [Marispirochaeta sp.]
MNANNPGLFGSRLADGKQLKERLITIFTKWEVLLCVIFLFQGTLFSVLTPYFLDSFNLMNANFTFMEKAVVALPMILVIMSGDIDISVASIIALSSFALGAASEAGASVVQLVLIGILVGMLAGAFNGFFVAYVGMPAIAVTLATQSLFRGISQAALGDQAYTSYPESFGFFGQGFVGDTIIPFELVVFLVLAVIMWFVLHQSSYGRKVYAVGNSKSAARFSGVNVERVRFINFMLNGLFCGIAAVLLTSRIGSTRPNIANGWDMEVITLVVLGGVSISGGKGNIFGVIVSIFLLGYLKFGMGLLNISGKIMIITTGLLLVIAVLLPMLLEQFRARRKLKF